ncbi:hypothetical protein KABACHOK_00150 [Brevundimonas phage vB_BpoS-Kabachok]|uniref:Uncharacterized protein n=1 Tax=Brevundimonas phage vB_BpoS-Kabachok TaxID=2948600 RepID=A0A9E7MQ85_9CAUD|nr:hypothetical protein KABACHOK_00150 [Brevundimonas phage vB_BpoS-Kabachok]
MSRSVRAVPFLAAAAVALFGEREIEAPLWCARLGLLVDQVARPPRCIGAGGDPLDPGQDTQHRVSMTSAPPTQADILAGFIRTRLIGVRPDDQDLILDDHDYQRLLDALEAVRVARQLARIASDWNLDEVEIDGEMKPIWDLIDQFDAVLNGGSTIPEGSAAPEA